MKTTIYHGEHGIDIEYIFRKASVASNVLVISFPGAGDVLAGVARGWNEWGYLVTLQKFKVHVLFLRANREYVKSRMTFRNREPVIENAVMSLIKKISEECKIERTIVAGSSMGGFCALWYGLKNDWDIIAGSPSYGCMRSRDAIFYTAGGDSEEDRRWFEEQMPQIMRCAGERGYQGHCFISYGEGEGLWRSPQYGPKLFSDLKSARINFEYELYPFISHATIHNVFPDILTWKLSCYLGMKGEGVRIGDHPSMTLSKAWDNSAIILKSLLRDRRRDIDPYFHIIGATHYGTQDPWRAIRNFVYITHGWYWIGKRQKPVQMKAGDDFWTFATAQDNNWAMCFHFQNTMLYYLETHDNREMYEWLVENVRQYLSFLPRKKDGNRGSFIFRVHFLIAFHRLLASKNEEKLGEWIAREVEKELMKITEFQGFLRFEWKYRFLLLFLHVSIYFSTDSKIRAEMPSVIFDLLEKQLDFDFDKNGFCISGQGEQQDILCAELHEIMRFVECNNFQESVQLKPLKKKYKKIETVTSHITNPEGILASYGSTIPQKSRTLTFANRSPGIFVLRESNLAFLEDEKSTSYITVNGGTNIHAICKHCDLLSFTWWYSGKQIFCDVGKGGEECEEYASSSIAHTAFICEGTEYVTPDYFDWTTIDSVQEDEGQVSIEMSHRLLEGIEMKRTLLWIKPNILVLLDEATAQETHKFSQNFLMNDIRYDLGEENRVVAHVAPDFNVFITQCSVGNDAVLQEYRGTDDVNDKEHFRGSLLPKQKEPSKGLNLVYTKEGENVAFLSVIECHSPSEKNGRNEKCVKGVRLDEGKIYVETV